MRKLLFKFIIFVWVNTVRRLKNFIINSWWNLKITLSPSLKTKVTETYAKVASATDPGEILSLFSEIYKKYEYDPIGGLIDWTASFSTAIVRAEGDCDDASEIMKTLGDRYCTLSKWLPVIRPETYTFFYTKSIKAIVRMHVMTVAEVEIGGKDKVILFDYNAVHIFNSMDEVHTYYVDSYIKNEKNMPWSSRPDLVSGKDVVSVKLPSPKSYKL